MSDLPGGDASAKAIHDAFAKTVRYTGAGLTNASILAVRTHGSGDLFMEHQQNVRELAFEVLKERLPNAPVKGNAISENDGAGPDWSVIEVVDLDEVDAWTLVVKSA